MPDADFVIRCLHSGNSGKRPPVRLAVCVAVKQERFVRQHEDKRIQNLISVGIICAIIDLFIETLHDFMDELLPFSGCIPADRMRRRVFVNIAGQLHAAVGRASVESGDALVRIARRIRICF